MTTTTKNRVLAQTIANNLFTNGLRQQADRLVLSSKEGRDLGGWCLGAVIDQIEDTLNDNEV